jgi:hypothetical protein
MNDAIRTMVHTQLIRYRCKSGGYRFVTLIKDTTGNTGLETLYIVPATKDEWEKGKCELRFICK